MLVAPQTQELTSVISGSMNSINGLLLGEILKDGDDQLGARETLDPNLFAIILMLPSPFLSDKKLRGLDLKLKNLWLRLAASVAAGLDIHGPGLPMGLFHDHRVHVMIAALSLLRYTKGGAIYTGSRLLASFLESREPVISSVALDCYMRTTVSYSDFSPPPSYLPVAVSAAFNLMLPDNLFSMGWFTLCKSVAGFETLSVEWRRTFAEGFFTSSRQRLPRSLGDMESSTPVIGLEGILTWGYLHEENKSQN